MKIKIKDGVFIKLIIPELFDVCRVVYEEYEKEGYEPVLTSGAEGRHGGRSYHFDGYAWDFRTYNVAGFLIVYRQIFERLKALSPYYDILLERKTGEDHIHVELDLRRKAKDQQLLIQDLGEV